MPKLRMIHELTVEAREKALRLKALEILDRCIGK
jgi:hypothetical protein